MALAKKAPNFNKKEEIFMTLTEHQVSMARAAWFIKLSSAYTVAVSEAKIKKRQSPDPTTEWTSTLIKFLKDQIPKLAEHYQNPPLNSSSDKSTLNPGNLTPSSNQLSNSGLNNNGSISQLSSGNNQSLSNQSGTGTTTIPHSMHSPNNPNGTKSSNCLRNVIQLMVFIYFILKLSVLQRRPIADLPLILPSIVSKL